MFHRRCGDRVHLVNNNCTAERNFSYDHGRVLSVEPLKDDEIFEVRVDKKIVSWSGTLEIGVTTCDPETLEMPAWATNIRSECWLMTGGGVVHGMNPITDPSYGARSSSLEEGDTVGVMRTSNHELVFFINGESQGVAATNIPPRVFAVVDMYGNCVQVTITRPRRPLATNEPKEEVEINNDFPLGEASNSSTTNVIANLNVNLNVNMNVNLPKNPSIAAIREDRLRFHERVGSLVKLSNNARTAERRRPLDEFNNGVVMTHRQLRDNELFEIRIDRLVDKWSGSIEVGVTTHSPTALEFPATMTNMRSGTTMMSGCGILTNGKGIQREYGEINLDELREGDRVGMIRRSNGNLHYLINGLDQGVAEKVPTGVWGVVELYGMTVKVTIVDRDEREEQNLVTRRNTLHLQGLDEVGDDEPLDRLTFHPCCGTHADVINNGRTAHRPNAMDDFNNGVVLTMRPLRPNELFEVRLDKIVTKWAGSIEIGVTTHSPTELEFPFTMTNVRSGTWIMTGNGVMHNGTTIIEQYGQNLDRLQVGDRVGVMRKDNATLHFYVNGADQGAAAVSVPERVYGVIDLYGQATQASIVDNTDFYSPTTNNSSFSNTTLYSDLRFHHVHGKHARITNNGLTASRIRALGEFNEAIVIANRALRDGELFEVSIDKMVGRWSGAIEAGVTAIRPDELEFPSTMTDIDHDTWMLSGSTVMRDGGSLRNHYACDLDKLTEGNRIGMMRCADSSLHYYLDGVDQGAACTGLPPHVYPVIDLYAQCAQVTIVLPERRDTMTQQYLPSENSTSQQPTSVLQPQPQTEIVHKFHQSVGLYLLINSDRFIAARCKKYNSAILLSEIPLESNELIEISIEEVAPEWSGSLKVGVLANESGNWFTSMGLVPGMTTIPPEAWYLTGNEVRHKGDVLCSNYCPSLDWLREDDKIGLKRTHEGNLKFYINGEDMGVAASNVPEMVHAVVELFGSTIAVCITSSKQQSSVISPNASLRLQDSLELLLDPMPPTIRNDMGVDTSIDGSEAKLLNEIALTPTQPISSSTGEIDWGYEFHENHGRNVELERKTTARRVASYNQGVLMSSRPLLKGKVFQVKIDKVTDRWVSGVLCGVTCISPEKASFPLTALGFKKHSWIICSDWMSHNGTKIKTRYGANLENLQAGCTVGLLLDEESRLHLFINGVDQGVAATDLPPYVYAVIDLYGQCEQISIVGPTVEATFMSNDAINMAIASTQDREEAEAEDVENSREKADLECHEKENAMPTIPSSLALNVASRSNDDANCGGVSEVPTSPHPSHSNNNPTHLLNNVLQNRAMSSSIQSDSNNSDTGSEMSNDAPRSASLMACGKLKNLASGTGGSLNSTNDSNTMANNELENDEIHRNECTNVEINNATNINIRNGSAATSSNMTNLNTAINSTNANNAINESIASNSQINNMIASNSNPNNLSTNMLNISQDNSMHNNAASGNNSASNMTSSVPNNVALSVPNNTASVSHNVTASVSNNTANVPNNTANVSNNTANVPNNTANVSNNTANVPNNVTANLPNNSTASVPNNLTANMPNNSTANNVTATLPNNVTANLPNNSTANNVTATLPNNVTASLPNNVTASLPNNVTATLPNNVTASVPNNVTATLPNNVTASLPNNVTASLPNNVTASVPNNVTASLPNNVTASLPNNVTASLPNNVTASLPNNVTASLPNNVTASVPNNASSNASESQTSSNRQCDSVLSNNFVSSVAVPNQNISNPSPQHNATLVGSLRVSSLPSTPLGTGVTSSKKCEYLKACTRLKKSLVLPDEFFSLDEVLCYCTNCYKVEGDGAICKKGEPPAEFAIPVGWARFPLKQSINANQIPQSTTDKWHVAFYGTRLDSIRWILDRGELLTKEQLDTSNLTTIINIEDQNPQVVFSPNIKYAASEESTRKYPYIDTQSNRKLNASTAFQLLVRPGSYTMGPAKDATDSQLESTEWATKEAGATVIVALLIHLDDF